MVLGLAFRGWLGALEVVVVVVRVFRMALLGMVWFAEALLLMLTGRTRA